MKWCTRGSTRWPTTCSPCASGGAAMSEQATLIVGADSVIGSHLLARLRSAGRRAFGTTRRREHADSSLLHLDLGDDFAEWPCAVSIAVMCAGVTKIDACRADPIGSERINVEGI